MPMRSLRIPPMSRSLTKVARRICVDPQSLEALGVARDRDPVGLGRSSNTQVALADVKENPLGLALEGIPVAATAGRARTDSFAGLEGNTTDRFRMLLDFAITTD